MKYTLVYGEVKAAPQLEIIDKSTGVSSQDSENGEKKSIPKQSIWLMTAGGVLLAGAAVLGILKRRGDQI